MPNFNVNKSLIYSGGEDCVVAGFGNQSWLRQ